MNKTWKITISLLLVFSVILNILTLVEYKRMEETICGITQIETTQSLDETLDELDQQSAERHFWYLKGQINEIYVLSVYLEIPKEVLQSRLEDIVTYQNFECEKDTNHYIADFKFVTPDSSTVMELCEILRSQINDYIISL